MKPGVRRAAYLISALAVVCFFTLPDPNLAVIGALLLQTLAYITVAGRSTADGIVLTGVTLILIGMMPSDHPLIRGEFFETVRVWLILSGVLVGLALVLRGAAAQRLVRKLCPACREERKPTAGEKAPGGEMPRPPLLCAGCPHRGLFYALNKMKAIVHSDIGCYTLSVLPPLFVYCRENVYSSEAQKILHEGGA